MINCIKKYKAIAIIGGVIIIALSSWYYLNNRRIQQEPDRADLVLNKTFFKSVEI
ncbi:hypothetical protein [Natronincola ferrireducens]|uniref:Uncharacterized protein n=1 Tax=Natronincola ferrireducens TaxID=393762 RepID=A0A1G9D7K1_9FIRM|nr:hypothetical protein [Natronincola ferrireducens]SDK59878.1 hypothetical protein SAMN05660472_01668 [Natronincola ferrireducens]